MQVNPAFEKQEIERDVYLCCEEAELDEQWSFVGKKSNQRWIWYAVDHSTNRILAYVSPMYLEDGKITHLKSDKYY